MAQYTVTAGCGHTTTVNLFGPVKERDRRIAWMRGETGKCNTCYSLLKRAEGSERETAEIERAAAVLRANARLIAAAPVMLTAIEAVLERLNNCSADDEATAISEACELLSAVAAKARGEQP